MTGAPEPPPAARDLSRLSVGALLDSLAARTPAPGGGSAAATAAALAAALVEMAAAFTLGRADLADAHERAGAAGDRGRELRARAMALADEDLTAFVAVIEASRLAPEDPARPARLREARETAARTPLEIAAAAAELTALAAELARDGNPNLNGDAVAGALLAEAACVAAVRLVELNLADTPAEHPIRAQAREHAARAGAARAQATGS